MTDEEDDNIEQMSQWLAPISNLSSSSSSRKRDYVKNDGHDNETKDIAEDDYDEDDIVFLSAEELERQQAEQRRIQRKQKLRRLQMEETAIQSTQTTQTIPTTTTTPTITTIATITTTNSTTNPNRHTNNNNNKIEPNPTDEHNNPFEEEDDEYDMFAVKSSSPLPFDKSLPSSSSMHDRENAPLHNDNQNQQQDWDDTEGYYKAVIGETIHLLLSDSSTKTLPPTTTGAPANCSTTIAFRVTGLIGKGVFSTVLKCVTLQSNENDNNTTTAKNLPPTVAIKLIRHNETMARAAQSELWILQKLNGSPGIIPLLLPSSTTYTTSTNSYNTSNTTNNYTSATNRNTTTSMLEYRGHVTFVFPLMEYNLRDVLAKFGKNVGLSLQSVRSYFGQLIAALTHLQKHNIIHSDIKPDNILVSADFGFVQIADFGSAMYIGNSTTTTNSSAGAICETTMTVQTVPTPYLVSRYYRAPEIILGIVPITYGIDLWSLAVTVLELFVGDVIFRGTSNNDMLYWMQQNLGPIPNRIVRQHLVQCHKYFGSNVLSNHFRPQQVNLNTTSGFTNNNNNNNNNNNIHNIRGSTAAQYCFTQRTIDAVTGAPVLKYLPLTTTRTNNTNTHYQLNKNNNKNSNNNASTTFPWATPLSSRLLRARSSKDSKLLVQMFSDLVHKCLLYDPSKRIPLKDALRHEFFRTATTGPTTTTTTTTSGNTFVSTSSASTATTAK